jgi:hypothetical protein
MRSHPTQPTSENQGFTNEALSNEVLKLKIDDLLQEVESLKRRVERLEGRADGGGTSDPGKVSPAKGVVSDPDSR